jgi:phytoene synthase
MSMADAAAEQAFQYCAQRVRESDKDRFLAALFVPMPQRGAVLALRAFDAELMQVRERISSPLPGEVRLQYWRDVLTGTGQGDSAGNPVAVALLQSVRRYALPIPALLDLIDARTFDLYDDPMTTLAELERYSAATSATVIRLTAHILNSGGTRDPEPATTHAGMAETVVHVLRHLPEHAAHGQCYLPADVLARHGASAADLLAGRATRELRAALAEMREVARHHLTAVRRHLGEMPLQSLPALLPIALLPPILRRMDSPRYDPYRPSVIPQWRRQWTLWRAAHQPTRFIGMD